MKSGGYERQGRLDNNPGTREVEAEGDFEKWQGRSQGFVGVFSHDGSHSARRYRAGGAVESVVELSTATKPLTSSLPFFKVAFSSPLPVSQIVIEPSLPLIATRVSSG